MRLDILQIPMYGLYYIDNSQEDIKLEDHFLNKLKNGYEADVINRIFEALEWAMANPDYDFHSLLPNLPVGNEEIFKYLSRWHECLQRNKEFLGIR